MNNNLIKPFLILGISIILSVLIYTFNTRYTLQHISGAPIVYKINRITGQTWLIEYDSEKPIKQSE